MHGENATSGLFAKFAPWQGLQECVSSDECVDAAEAARNASVDVHFPARVVCTLYQGGLDNTSFLGRSYCTCKIDAMGLHGPLCSFREKDSLVANISSWGSLVLIGFITSGILKMLWVANYQYGMRKEFFLFRLSLVSSVGFLTFFSHKVALTLFLFINSGGEVTTGPAGVALHLILNSSLVICWFCSVTSNLLLTAVFHYARQGISGKRVSNKHKVFHVMPLDFKLALACMTVLFVTVLAGSLVPGSPFFGNLAILTLPGAISIMVVTFLLFRETITLTRIITNMRSENLTSSMHSNSDFKLLRFQKLVSFFARSTVFLAFIVAAVTISIGSTLQNKKTSTGKQNMFLRPLMDLTFVLGALSLALPPVYAVRSYYNRIGVKVEVSWRGAKVHRQIRPTVTPLSTESLDGSTNRSGMN